MLIHFCVEVLRKSSFLFVSNNTMNHESVKFHAERCHVFRVKSRKSCWMKQSRFCLQNRVKYTVSKKRQKHLESRMWISVKFPILSSIGFGFDGLTDPSLCRSIKGFDCRKRTRAGSLLIRNVHDFYFACASCDAQISAGSWLRRGYWFQGMRCPPVFVWVVRGIFRVVPFLWMIWTIEYFQWEKLQAHGTSELRKMNSEWLFFVFWFKDLAALYINDGGEKQL